jgi:hypothetical protein
MIRLPVWLPISTCAATLRLEITTFGCSQSTRGGAVQVDRINSPVESAPGVCNQRLKLKCDDRFQTLLSNSTCAATTRMEHPIAAILQALPGCSGAD